MGILIRNKIRELIVNGDIDSEYTMATMAQTNNDTAIISRFLLIIFNTRL